MILRRTATGNDSPTAFRGKDYGRQRQHREETIKVLLVDDEVGFADVLAKRLGKRGMAVTPVYTGTERFKLSGKTISCGGSGSEDGGHGRH